MRGTPRPPARIELLLQRLLAGPGAEFLLGDLEEEFHRLTESRGPAAARRWYRLHALRAAVAWWHPLAWRARRRSTSVAGRTPPVRGLVLTIVVGSLAVGLLALTSSVQRTPLPGASLPTGAASTLVFVHAIDRHGARHVPFTFPELDVLRRETTSFERLAGYSLAERELRQSDGRRRQVRLGRASEDLFEALDARAAIGRLFTDEELHRGADVVVLGHALWLDAFAGDASVVGSTVALRDVPVEIVGVAAEGSGLPADADLWRPASDWLRRDTDREVLLVARVAAGVELDHAGAQVAALMGRLPSARYGPAGVQSAWLEPVPARWPPGRRLTPSTSAPLAAGTS